MEAAGIAVTTIEKGQARPTEDEMKVIFENNEIVIIGTSQKIQPWMWARITTPRIVATASVGIDHIRVPEEKRALLTILNTPIANAQSVAEYTVGAMMLAKKRFFEGNALYTEGKNNKNLIQKPEDIHDAVVGLVGAGHISTRIIELLQPFGVRFLCYTKHPEHHLLLRNRFGVKFVSLEALVENADIISVNVPNDKSTEGLISARIIERMKDTCVFISVSRASVSDNEALFVRAEKAPNFYVILDLDVFPDYVGRNNGRNILITPHIAGGTIETRKRMFREVTDSLVLHVQKRDWRIEQ